MLISSKYSSPQRLLNRNSGKSRSLANKNKRSKKQDKMVIFDEPGRFSSDNLICVLKFVDQTTSRTHASSVTANYSYRSSAYDPDPALGTGAIPGFVELANLYENYRVLSMRAKITVMNQDTNSFILGAWPSNSFNPLNSLLSSDVQEFSGNPGGVQCMLGPNGTRPTSFVLTGIGESLFGPQYLTGDDYVSSTNSNPSISFYLNIGWFQYNGVNMSFPLALQCAIEYEVHFFGRRQLES